MTSPPRTYTVALVGNPNCGKSTLFNALTGSHARVGNWPGVTVEIKTGEMRFQDILYTIVDLPGTYALNQPDVDGASDEEIAQCFLAQEKFDVIVNVVAANNLERHLYLTTQCHDFSLPVIVAVNMIDIAHKHHLALDLPLLAHCLDMPCCAISASKNEGLERLKQLIADHVDTVPARIPLFQLEEKAALAVDYLSLSIQQVMPEITAPKQEALRLLEGGHCRGLDDNNEIADNVAATKAIIQQHYQEDADIVLIDQRYQAITNIVGQVVSKNSTQPTRKWTNRWDNLFLHRYLGIPSFLVMMYLLFFCAINIGGALQEFFDLASAAIFVDTPQLLLTYWQASEWLTAIVAHGVGGGINTTLTFIPVIAAMFFFMGLLEDSGYMTRAAFVMDRAMRAVGLSGKAFVPMLIGFGCNVPAVMAARNLDNARDRLLASLMIPFMSCGARLAIFAVFVAAFFKQGGHNIIFGLYLIGMLTAILTAALLTKTRLRGKPAPFIMELPLYQRPHLAKIIKSTRQRLQSFVLRAGQVIIPVCILLGVLNHVSIQTTTSTKPMPLIEIVGKAATPLFTPMGITEDNWPATVGLVSGVLAKEVVIGTLNSLYNQIGDVAVSPETPTTVGAKLQEAVISIPVNLSALPSAIRNPLLASQAGAEMAQPAMGVMEHYFAGTVGAFAYLLFVLLYFPCVSTVAVMRKEIGTKWAAFSMVWSTGIAYLIATDYYQMATLSEHPQFSIIWLLSSVAILAITLGVLNHAQFRRRDILTPARLSHDAA